MWWNNTTHSAKTSTHTTDLDVVYTTTTEKKWETMLKELSRSLSAS